MAASFISNRGDDLPRTVNNYFGLVRKMQMRGQIKKPEKISGL